MSLVLRVIRDDTENLLYSADEKEVTLSNKSLRISLDSIEPTREARKLTIIEDAHAAKDIPSIMPPTVKTCFILTAIIPSVIILDMYEGNSSSHSASHTRNPKASNIHNA